MAECRRCRGRWCYGTTWFRRKDLELSLCSAELDGIDSELRDRFQWQRRFADALNGYTNKVVDALQALVHVHEALDSAGICDVEESAAIARALNRGFREAHEVARRAGEAGRELLNTHSVTLTAASEVLQEADSAAAEARRYTRKLELLQQEAADRDRQQLRASHRAQARLDRTRNKLITAERTAEVKRARATDSLQRALDRKDNLCSLARDAMVGTARALRSAVSYLSPDGEIGFEVMSMSEDPSSEASPAHSHRPFGLELGDWNPRRLFPVLPPPSREASVDRHERLGTIAARPDMGPSLDLQGLDDETHQVGSEGPTPRRRADLAGPAQTPRRRLPRRWQTCLAWYSSLCAKDNLP